MSSPVLFGGKPFKLVGVPDRQFCLLGNPVGNRGILHTAFLAKPLVDPTVSIVEEPVRLNGFCQYAFLHSVGGICGFILITPTSNTQVKTVCVVVGTESDSYKTLLHLEPQGVLIMESSDSNTVFVSTTATDSTLLVKVDL